jgi:hypothetical protein
MEEVGKGFAENFVLLERCIPWQVQKRIVLIEGVIAQAKAEFERERHGTQFRETHKWLTTAADLINVGIASMERYHTAMQRGGKIAIAYIKWGSIVVTMPYTGSAGIAATGVNAIRIAVAGKTAEEGTTLLARYLSGEKLTNDDLRQALREVLMAGGTAAIGEVAGYFAGPVAARIFRTKTPTPSQLDAVKETLVPLVSNNTELAVKALVNLSQGKAVEWDWWASAAAPLLPPEAGAAVKERDVRDGAAAAVGK